MYSSQISNALKKDPYASKYFVGVFPSDALPKRIKYPSAVVANTDPSDEKGEHWVCYFFDKNKNAEYFDSYGLPPIKHDLFNFLVEKGCIKNHGKKIKCNEVQLQAFNSDVCGQYCIAFIARKARGESMDNIVKSYEGKKPGDADYKMAQIVNNKYNISVIPKQHGRGTNDQCCCSMIHSKLNNNITHCSFQEKICSFL